MHGHVAYMGEIRSAYKSLVSKPGAYKKHLETIDI
jgi:hypothetical protein